MPQYGVDIGQLLVDLWKKRFWIGGSIVVCFTASLAAAFLTTPVYRSSTVLVPANMGAGGLRGSLETALDQLGGLGSFVGAGFGSENSDTEEALAVLRSRQFTERFLNDNNLMPELYSSLWNETEQEWRVDRRRQPTPAKAYKMFDEGIRTIVQDKKSGLITLHIDWTDREKAATWANSLVTRLNAEMRQRAIVKADASLGFLRQELVGTPEVGTREAIGRLIEAQIQQRMLANVSPEYVFRVVDKALPADEDDIFRPRRVVLLLGGPLLGLGIGVIGVLLIRTLRQGAQ